MSNTTNTDSTDTSALDRVTALLSDPFGSTDEVRIDTGAADLLELVANDRRRHALRVLADGPVSKAVLARQVAAREHGCGVAEITRDQRKRAYVSLHQTHLPQLVDAGLVTELEDMVHPDGDIDAALDVWRTATAVANGDTA